jgi:transcriptional regulator with XRE-family HTH domain
MQAHKVAWGQAIREGRERLGLNQEQFAELLGVEQSAVSHWEAGHWAPSAENQLKIAKAFKKPHRKIFDLEAAAAQ